MGVEPEKARRRREYSNTGRNFFLLTIDKYVNVRMNVVIELLCSVAFNSAYCHHGCRLVQNGSGSAGCRYCDNYRYNNHHVLFLSAPACGKVTVIPFFWQFALD